MHAYNDEVVIENDTAILKNSHVQSELKKFSINDARIEEAKAKYGDLVIKDLEDKTGYLAVKEARLDVKGMRVKVEKTRKELVKDAVDFQRVVNGEAKRLTNLLEPLETALETQEEAYDAERERLKQDKERRDSIRLQGRVDKLTSLGMVFLNGKYSLFALDEKTVLGMEVDILLLKTMSDEDFDTHLELMSIHADEKKTALAEIERQKAEEAARVEQERLAAQAQENARRAAEQAAIERMRQEQEAVQKKLDEANAKLEETRKQQEAEAATLKAEQERLDAEKRAIETAKQREADEKAKAEDMERARQEAAQKAIEEAKEEERLKIEKEERRKALMPDKEKLQAMCKAIDDIDIPAFSNPSMLDIAMQAHHQLSKVIGFIHIEVAKLEKA